MNNCREFYLFVCIFEVLLHKDLWYLNRKKGEATFEDAWKEEKEGEQQEDAS